MSTYENLLLTHENGIAVLTINRPKQLNALSQEVLTELDLALDELNNNHEVRVVLITGAGDKAFVAGADIKQMMNYNTLEGQAFSRLGNAVFSKLANLRQPTIACLNGFTLGGGCELALACDIRFGTPKTKLGQPEVSLGIIPGFGGTQRLARLVGPAHAKDLIFTGRMVGSEEALQMGLINKIFDAETLLEQATDFAKLMLKQAPLAVERSKDAINVGLDLPLNHALLYEAELFGSLFSSEDQKEGMAAFVDKRKAEFKNR